jgi:kynureninase
VHLRLSDIADPRMTEPGPDRDPAPARRRIYLDGNSLGPPQPLVRAALERLVEAWDRELIGGWNNEGWWDLPVTVGDRLGRLVGAAPGQVVATDTTSVNLFRLLWAALELNPGRSRIVVPVDDFPTDRYIVNDVAERCSLQVVAVPHGALVEAISDETAVVVASHVHFRTGELADMVAVTDAAHSHGAPVLWDLSHSIGALDVAIDECCVDFAVGCSYKYLNGGPGAPAWLYVAQRHHDVTHNIVPGWVGHASPFDIAETYVPAHGIRRMLSGTPPVAGLIALDAALSAFDGLPPAELWSRSQALTGRFIEHVDTTLAPFGLDLVTPRDSGRRGSHVSLMHPNGYEVIQACIEAGVVGDYREPHICRFGFAPLYLSSDDVDEAALRIAAVMESGVWQHERFRVRRHVT